MLGCPLFKVCAVLNISEQYCKESIRKEHETYEDQMALGGFFALEPMEGWDVTWLCQGPYLGQEWESFAAELVASQICWGPCGYQPGSMKSGQVQSGFWRINCTSAIKEDFKKGHDRGVGMKRGGWAPIKRPSSVWTQTLTMTSVSSGSIS